MNISLFTIRHFSRDLILVFLLLTTLVIGSVSLFTVRARQTISQKYIDNSATSAVRQFSSMADSMSQTLKLADDWIASRELSLSDVDELNELFFPVLKQERILSGISVADTQGNGYYLTAHDDGWRTSETRKKGDEGRSVIRFWDSDRQQVSVEKKSTSYDPRSRPWFAPALSMQAVYWTLPYTFFGHKQIGITASIARETEEGSKQTVVAFDILLDDLFREIQRMGPSENSRVFIIRNDARLYVPGADNEASDFRSMMEVKDPLVRKMITAWEGGHESAYTKSRQGDRNCLVESSGRVYEHGWRYIAPGC